MVFEIRQEIQKLIEGFLQQDEPIKSNFVQNFVVAKCYKKSMSKFLKAMNVDRILNNVKPKEINLWLKPELIRNRHIGNDFELMAVF